MLTIQVVSILSRTSSLPMVKKHQLSIISTAPPRDFFDRLSQYHLRAVSKGTPILRSQSCKKSGVILLFLFREFNLSKRGTDPK